MSVELFSIAINAIFFLVIGIQLLGKAHNYNDNELKTTSIVLIVLGSLDVLAFIIITAVTLFVRATISKLTKLNERSD